MSFNLKDIDWNEFRKPPKSARPMVRWWWTGLDVEKEELIREVQELDEAGFYGAEIQVFMIGSPMKLEKKDKARAERCHRFMQPYYYDMIKAVLDEASKRDMIMDVTIGSAWPAGGSHIAKEDSMKVLLVGQKKLKGPRKYSGRLPKIKKPIAYKIYRLLKLILGYNIGEYWKEDMKLEALVAFKSLKQRAKIKYLKPKAVNINKESIIDLTDKVNSENILEWDVPEGKWQIFAFYKGPSGIRPLLNCRSSPNEYGLVLDHLYSEVIRKHLDLHLGEGKKYFKEHFGKVLRAFFTDSIELSSEWLWTDDFLDQFENRRGYNLRPFLPVCFVPNRDNKYAQALMGGETPIVDIEDVGERIRYDFELTISDLFSEVFVKTMEDWANENKLKNRIQTYGIRADTLKAYRFSHIPETEQLYAGGVIDFLKLAGSAGLIYEKPIITAESIVWNQRDYMTTPLKWKVAADRLFVSGINQMIYHGFPYQNSLFPYPGYCGFSTRYIPKQLNFSSNFSRMNPFWEFFPLINMYITRCQYILQRGKTVSNIAIYFSTFNYCDSVLKREELVGGLLDEHDAPLGRKEVDAHRKRPDKWNHDDKWTFSLLELTDEITQNGYFYTHVNEESILESVEKNKRVLMGSTEFDVIIFPNIERISLDLAIKINNLAKAGVSIIFLNDLPLKQNGYLDYEINDEKINSIINELVDSGTSYFISGISEFSLFLKNKLKISSSIEFKEPQPMIYYIHKNTENSDIFFLRNSQNKPKNISITFNIDNKLPFLLDPWTGETYQAYKYEILKDSIEMNLDFNAFGSIIIEFKAAEEEVHSKTGPKSMKRINNSLIGDSLSSSISPIYIDKWNFKTNIRQHTGNLSPFEIELKELINWQEIPGLKYCSSKGYYTSSFQIDGKYVQEDLKLMLSLERVHDVAVIKLNGKKLPPLLTYPFELDITEYIKEGNNEIEIEITPTLRNRLIGYGKKGGKNWKNHKKKKEFMPSGLIGTVLITPFEKIKIK